jgi:hypothetical protein
MYPELWIAVWTFALTNLMWISVLIGIYWVVIRREIFHSDYFRHQQKEHELTQASMLDRFMEMTGTLSGYQDARERLYRLDHPEEEKELTDEEQDEIEKHKKIGDFLANAHHSGNALIGN